MNKDKPIEINTMEEFDEYFYGGTIPSAEAEGLYPTTEGYVPVEAVAYADLPNLANTIAFQHTPQPSIQLCGPDFIMKVFDPDGNLMVHITLNGEVKYGEGIIEKTPEAYVAMQFWQAVADHCPMVQEIAKLKTELKFYKDQEAAYDVAAAGMADEIDKFVLAELFAETERELGKEAFERAMRIVK